MCEGMLLYIDCLDAYSFFTSGSYSRTTVAPVDARPHKVSFILIDSQHMSGLRIYYNRTNMIVKNYICATPE